MSTRRLKLGRGVLFIPLRQDWQGLLHWLMAYLPPRQQVLKPYLITTHWWMLTGEHDGSPGSVDSASEGVGQMGAHEGMAGEASGTLGS
ncbi:hypothetical protein Bca101_031530 [Brassica carinata]